MTEKEKQLIMESIKAYQRMIKYFQERIEDLSLKMQDKCCFEGQIVHRIPIKEGK